MNDSTNNQDRAANLSGFQCGTCCARAGQPHVPGCPETGLASAVRMAIEILAQVDMSKVPLAVPAALGVLRTALPEPVTPIDATRTTSTRFVIVALLAVATAAWHALDDGEQMSDGSHRVSATDATALAASLGVLDELPDDKPGYVLHGPARAEWALRQVLVSAAQAGELGAAARDVLAERRRQVDQEGWAPQHDDEHQDRELAIAAGCYAIYGARKQNAVPPPEWPWSMVWWKPRDYRANLVRAGALILAEIERIDRAAQRAAT